MIESLMKMIQDQVGDQLKSEHKLNDNQVNTAMGVTKDSLMEVLKENLMSGNFQDIINVFNGKGSESSKNALSSSISTKLSGGLNNKMGLSGDVVDKIKDLVLPIILKKFSGPETGKAKNNKDLLSKLGLDLDSDFIGKVSQFLVQKGGILASLKKIFGGK